MPEMISGPRPITEITIRGGRHAARLEYLTALIEHRATALDAAAAREGVREDTVRWHGPAFLLHVLHVADALADHETRASIEHAVRHGGRCGVVVKLYGTRTAVSVAVSVSEALTAAFLDGRTLQLVEPTAGGERPSPSAGLPAPGAPGHLAAAVMAGNALAAGDYLAGLVLAASEDRVAMAFLGRELRRAADAIDPNGGRIPCPLCLASPLFAPDEIEGHLVLSHAQLAEGMRTA